MPYIDPALVAKAREMDLLTYLHLCAPHELIRTGASTYQMRSHSSLKLSNGKWMWWAGQVGGVSALDYLIAVEGVPFLSAVEQILTLKGTHPLNRNCQCSDEQVKTAGSFSLPPANANNEQVIRYLIGRGIDPQIVEYCIREKLLYEDAKYHSAIFVGYSEDGQAAYAAYRATKPGVNRKGEISGSQKMFSFRIVPAQTDTLHVFEGAIDALSYLTLMRMNRMDWKNVNCLSLGGVAAARKVPAPLQQYLQTKATDRVILHLDNDTAGRQASRCLLQALEKGYEVRVEYPTWGKDVNDELCKKRSCTREAR